ncbi:MAG: dockerin type I domain-containing protein [Tepidisphaeraceae bacterium]
MRQDDDQSGFPTKLTAALQEMHSEIRVPGEVDDAILSAARAAIVRRRWHRGLLRWTGVGAAAAAMLVFAVQLVKPDRPAASRAIQSVALREDLDGSGRVDILDAFYLARRLGNPPQRGWDVNGDGQIDQRDVDAVAQAAVHVGGTL